MWRARRGRLGRCGGDLGRIVGCGTTMENRKAMDKQMYPKRMRRSAEDVSEGGWWSVAKSGRQIRSFARSASRFRSEITICDASLEHTRWLIRLRRDEILQLPYLLEFNSLLVQTSLVLFLPFSLHIHSAPCDSEVASPSLLPAGRTRCLSTKHPASGIPASDCPWSIYALAGRDQLASRRLVRRTLSSSRSTSRGGQSGHAAFVIPWHCFARCSLIAYKVSGSRPGNIVTHRPTHLRETAMKSFITASFAIALLAVIGESTEVPCTGVSTLKEEAQRRNVLIGSGAINPSYLDDPQFATVLAEQFESLSPENELKWSFIHPTRDHYNWETIDRLVEFAEEHDMVVKAHGLISRSFNPDYLVNLTDPSAFRAVMTEHFEAIMHRYCGKLDRWDVVTEALETQGSSLEVNDFYKVLGSGYVAEAFRIAHAADPQAKLFINENLVETIPEKRQGLYDLVTGLVADGVPLHGVALQMHITEVAPTPGVITAIVESYTALGLEVTIAEMDAHTLNATLQTEIYGAVVKESLEAGITEISFWGFTDKHHYTWLPGAKPLLFTEEYVAKGAFYATHAALEHFAEEKSEKSC